jgi:hypothetical protein
MIPPLLTLETVLRKDIKLDSTAMKDNPFFEAAQRKESRLST